MSFYNPYQKSPDFGQGINDFVAKLMQMMMMKQVFGQQGGQQQPGVEASGQAQLGQPGQAPMVGAGIGSQQQHQPTMGAGPPGMAQAGMAQNMAQQAQKDLKISPELLQALMMMLNPNTRMQGGMNMAGMMGGGPR